MFLRRIRSGDNNKANALLGEAAAIYRECGLDARAAEATARTH